MSIKNKNNMKSRNKLTDKELNKFQLKIQSFSISRKSNINLFFV